MNIWKIHGSVFCVVLGDPTQRGFFALFFGGYFFVCFLLVEEDKTIKASIIH